MKAKEQIAAELSHLIADFRSRHAGTLDVLIRNAARLKDVSQQISRSWSGSFAGWHGNMYFRNFEVPALNRKFSGEWGAINGLPLGWEEKQPEVVCAKIEEIIGDHFSVDEFEKSVESAHKDVLTLKHDIVGCLDALDISILPDRGKEVASWIEKFKGGRTKGEFIFERLPRTLMSRDTEALREGTCVPSWLYYESVSLSAMSLRDAATELLDKGERLAKLLQHESPADVALNGLSLDLHPNIYAKCHELYEAKAFAEAVEKGFKVVRDRLRALTGHETGSEAFGKSKLHIRGAAAPHVDEDFNQAVKFLTMAIDRFRNEKSHTSDAKIDDPIRAYEYLRLSSLAMNLLNNAEIAQ